jgi:hypothetical protein
VSDEPKCTSCGVPYSAHLGIVGTCAKLTEALARIAELESRAQPAEGVMAVRLPQIRESIMRTGLRHDRMIDADEMIAALRAAGIAVEDGQ